eukprot:g5508.t3
MSPGFLRRKKVKSAASELKVVHSLIFASKLRTLALLGGGEGAAGHHQGSIGLVMGADSTIQGLRHSTLCRVQPSQADPGKHRPTRRVTLTVRKSLLNTMREIEMGVRDDDDDDVNRAEARPGRPARLRPSCDPTPSQLSKLEPGCLSRLAAKQ